MFLTLKEDKIEAEITQKKSKFIATIFYVRNEEEALNIIRETKKHYYDARHNCFAYRIATENGIQERQSDDGEPSGTAGAPILNILNKNNLCNILVIVTRYFGGILLGTGGLVRAYSEATTKAIEKAQLATETLGYEAELEINYSELENIKYYCKTNNINITNIEFENNVKCYVEVTKEELDKIVNNIYSNCNIINYSIVEKRNIRKVNDKY